MRLMRFSFRSLWLSLLSLAMLCFCVGVVIFVYLEQQLPNVSDLKHVQFQVPLRIYSADDKLMAEFGAKRRIPVTLAEVPPQLVQALVATEDQRYYEHPGVDPIGLARALVAVILTGHKVEGGSTITMQVARNFYLSRKKTYSRKLKEIMLALKLDRELSKDKILELYLNKIYLGNRAYGVAAAAQVYYGKPLNELDLPQLAMIAGLPQAPSAENPLANPEAALMRRDHVLERMRDLHYIDESAYKRAIDTPLTATYHELPIEVHAPYVAELVRQILLQRYGDKIYTDGFQVYTTINSQLQHDANAAVRDALLAYDRRHGYRGPLGNLGNPNKMPLNVWLKSLQTFRDINGLLPAAITAVSAKDAQAMLANGQIITIPWEGLSWARRSQNNLAVGPAPKTAFDVVKVGDVIRVIQEANHQYMLAEVPKVEGALVSMDPDNGALRALVGGFSYQKSKFNRAIQAERQPGSSFKPFIYSAALAKGYTLATLINDAPIVIEDPSLQGLWRPQNDNHTFYGPIRFRMALAQSRNLVSIRLLQNIGIDYAIDYLRNFSFEPSKIPHSLSMVLGTALVSPLQMATGYSVLANGGYKVTPFVINHITNAWGQIIYQHHPKIACESCIATGQQTDPNIPEAQQATQVISPQIAFLMTSAMKDVIRHGTGRGALVLHRTDLAGKTGTTNNLVDAWFDGFNSDLVTIAWVGFDQPRSLYEFGAQAALPMWVDFMGKALAGKPENTMPEPPDIVTVRIDRQTGLLAGPNDPDAFFEYFRKQYEPTQFSRPSQESSRFETTQPVQNGSTTPELY